MTLRDARRERNLTQEQLAELAGVDQATISKLERDETTKPSWEIVGRIARALGIDPHLLFPLEVQSSQEAGQ